MYKYLKIYQSSFRSLLRHKLRSGLSMLGIVCGVMAVFTIISVGEGARQKIIRQIEQLGIRNIYIRATALTDEQKRTAAEKQSPGLSMSDRDRITSGCAYVSDIACLKEVSASVPGMKKNMLPQILSVSSAYANMLNLFVSQGRFIADQDIEMRNPVCVVGAGVAENAEEKGRMGSYIRIENHLFRVVGILERSDRKTEESTVISVRNYNGIIFIPLGTEGVLSRSVPGKIGQENHELSEIIVSVRKTGEVTQAGHMLKRIMALSHKHVADYQIVIPRELLRQAGKTRRMLNIFLAVIAGISLLVGGIGIMNIMLATVSERVGEIGVRRAVGATQWDIVIQFLSESVILTFFGGLFGIVSGVMAVHLLSRLGAWDTVISAPAFILPLLMSLLVGIFFGLYPAYRAARTDPITALRHE